MSVTVRAMQPDEMAFALDLAATEGWNPGLHDAATFHAVDPSAFLLAEADGQPVGCIGASRYGDRFGFVGLHLVRPEWRGRGVGRQLWNAAMARLDGLTVALDAPLAQQPALRAKGFEVLGQTVRHAIRASVAREPIPRTLVPLNDVDFDYLIGDDQRTFPAKREAFLKEWTSMPSSTGLAWVEGNNLGGWGVIRRCVDGHRIGPLVADTPAIAQTLIVAMTQRVRAGDAVHLDIPLDNFYATAIAQSMRMQPVFEVARMATAPLPAIESSRVYGVTTLELG